jgi:hypothetical protein
MRIALSNLRLPLGVLGGLELRRGARDPISNGAPRDAEVERDAALAHASAVQVENLALPVGGAGGSAGRCTGPAITSGWWFGSMTPPEPIRSVVVASARCAISTAGAELAILGML